MLSTKRLCKQCSKNVCRGLQPWFTIAEGRIKPGWVQLPVRQFLTDGQAKPLRPTKGKSSKNEVKQFVDYKQVKVFGGKGGDGRISLLSVFGVEFAGADGGNGGHGGHVMFVADSQISDLSRLSTVLKAPAGKPGGLKKMDGRDAEHRYINVPVGTLVRNLQGEVVCDLAKPGSMFIAAKGGAGGKGNTSFKSSTFQTPQIAEIGATGETFIYNLELRTMADVGLIGFPNAGKSTLLQAISRARPKIAAYPFTTLNPHIGMVMYDDLTNLAVADLPGLIAGASKNEGLGHTFLRHVERCRLLLYVIDLSQENPRGQLDCLQNELEEYSAGLSGRPSAIVANKIDLPESRESIKKLQGCQLEVLPISGRTGLGLTTFLTRIKQLSDQDQRLVEMEKIEQEEMKT